MWRVKTEQEFLAEYGENWRVRDWEMRSGASRHLWPTNKDKILGKTLSDHISVDITYTSKAILRDEDKVWTITAEMIIEEVELEF